MNEFRACETVKANPDQIFNFFSSTPQSFCIFILKNSLYALMAYHLRNRPSHSVLFIAVDLQYKL